MASSPAEALAEELAGEIRETVATLRGEGPPDFSELVLDSSTLTPALARIVDAQAPFLGSLAYDTYYQVLVAVNGTVVTVDPAHRVLSPGAVAMTRARPPIESWRRTSFSMNGRI